MDVLGKSTETKGAFWLLWAVWKLHPVIVAHTRCHSLPPLVFPLFQPPPAHFSPNLPTQVSSCSCPCCHLPGLHSLCDGRIEAHGSVCCWQAIYNACKARPGTLVPSVAIEDNVGQLIAWQLHLQNNGGDSGKQRQNMHLFLKDEFSICFYVQWKFPQSIDCSAFTMLTYHSMAFTLMCS